MSTRIHEHQRRGPGRIGRRETPANVPDVESVQGEQNIERSPSRVRQETQEEVRQNPPPPPPQYEPERMMKMMEEIIAENRALRERQEILELREENRRLREEGARDRPQVVPQAPPAPVPGRLIRRALDDEGV